MAEVALVVVAVEEEALEIEVGEEDSEGAEAVS